MICRLCLNHLTTEEAIILFTHSEESELIKIIAKYLFLEITENDSVSTYICFECSTHLKDFHKYCNYVEEKQNSLRNEFFELKCSVVVSANTPIEPLIQQYNDESLLDMKELIECETEVNVLPEEEFSCAINDENGDDYNNEVINADDGTEIKTAKIIKRIAKDSSSSSKRKCRKNVLTARKSKLKVKLIQSKGKSTALGSEDNKTDSETTTKSELEKSNSLDDDKKNDELIANYLQLKCDLCNVSVETFAKLLTHFKSVHNCKGYVECCGRQFKKRILLIEHIQIHLNPKHFQCKLCKKVLKSRYSLDMHMQTTHTRREDLKYQCTVCEKRFACKNNLKHHALAHQTEKSYVCEHCEKAFATQYRLNAHVKTMHANLSLYICDFCGREFKFKRSFEQHVAEHQGIIREPPVQCTICGRWFKFQYLLKMHLKNHNAVEVKCEQCGRICPTPRALKSHITYAHTKKNDLRCSFCEKAFKKKRNLEEHMAIHTGEKHNPCPHCPKEFRSKANMYVHIKRDHFEEWDKKRSRIPPFPIEEVST